MHPFIQMMTSQCTQPQSAVLPIEVVRDVWMALHETKHCEDGDGLDQDEEALYSVLTIHLKYKASILSVEVTKDTQEEPNNENESETN